MHLLKNNAFNLSDIVDLNTLQLDQLNIISASNTFEEKCKLSDSFFKGLDEKYTLVDQCLRERLNYILDRKGDIKVMDMHVRFNTSKYSLQRQFIKKIGMSPKSISKIWRFNYFLQLMSEFPGENMTSLGIEAGYFDQAHLIRDFKSFFAKNPRKIFESKEHCILYSQQIIQKRFNNLYDPTPH